MLRTFHVFDVLAEPDKKDKEYKESTKSEETPTCDTTHREEQVWTGAKLTSDMS